MIGIMIKTLLVIGTKYKK